MRIHIMGRHAHRTPFAYPAYRALFSQRFDYVDDPEQADVILFGYVLNIDENAEALARLIARKPTLKLVVVSEEPLWDTTNSGDFRKRHNIRNTGAHSFAYAVINHHTSQAYHFDRLPYFLTTDDRFPLRYAREFAANARLGAADYAALWKAAPIRYAFFAENRDLVKKYSISHPDIETFGLSVYRSDVAKGMPDKGTLRVGQGWGTATTRQSLPDWHLDKIVMLQNNAFVISAVENTNQINYVSEKLFDAFACRGLPLYWASGQHRVTEIVPEGAFVNLHGLSAPEAAARITGLRPDSDFLDAYVAAQTRLHRLFRALDGVIEARLGFYRRLSDELEAVVSEEAAAAA